MAVSVEASPAGCRTGEWWTYGTQVQLAVDICTLALLFVADVIRDELSIDTMALNCLVFQKFAFLHFSVN